MSSMLNRPLGPSEINFRVQSVNKGGYATILAYKDARVDINRLNMVFGPGNWQRKHDLIGDRLYCSVGLWNDDLKQWCWVQDVGTESYTEAEKGQASDAFKRACFNLGVGIELYDYPEIKIKLKDYEFDVNNGKAKQTYRLNLNRWYWKIRPIKEDEKDTLLLCSIPSYDLPPITTSVSFLQARDEDGTIRFTYDIERTPQFLVKKHLNSILSIKENLSIDNLSTASEAYNEIPKEDVEIIWKAPSKGGVFTTKELQIMKSKEFREAYFGPSNE